MFYNVAMTFDIEGLRELPGLVSGRLPGAVEVGDLKDAALTASLEAIGSVRRELDAAAALIAATVARRSSRDLGTDGLAQRRGHKDGAGLVEELAGIGRAEATKLVRIGGLLETAHAVAPVPPGGDAAFDDEAEAAARPPRDIRVLCALPGQWDAGIGVALRNGWLTAAQGDALHAGLGAPSAGLEDRWREAALELIEDCWTGRWSPEDLARAAKRMRSALDNAAARAEAQRRYELRSLRRTVRSSGMVHYDIELDPESDARFFGPIKRLLSPRFGGPRFTAQPDVEAAAALERDPRSNEQLQVDTLLELVDRAVASSGKELFPTGEPQVMIAVTATELATARAAERGLQRHHAGDHTGCTADDCLQHHHAGDDTTRAAPAPEGNRSCPMPTRAGNSGCPSPDAGIAWIDGRDEAITALDALRMICAGGFTPALFDETGRAIDIGKDQRLFTRTQRRALAKRDGGCLYPGCDRPPEDCESHHINPWAADPSHRKTEVRDGVLLCRRHHKLIHDHGARVERRHDAYWLHWPGHEPRRLHTKAGVQTQLRAQSMGR